MFGVILNCLDPSIDFDQNLLMVEKDQKSKKLSMVILRKVLRK